MCLALFDKEASPEEISCCKGWPSIGKVLKDFPLLFSLCVLMLEWNDKAVEPGLLHDSLHFAWQFKKSYESGKTGKNEDDNFFAAIFKIQKLSSCMKSDQNNDLWNLLHEGSQFLNIFIISKNSLKISKNVFCNIHTWWFHQLVFLI